MTINTQKLREAAANAKSLTTEDLIGFRLTATAHITGLARAIESCCGHIEAQAAEIARLRDALTAIEQWDVPVVESRGEAVSMSVAYGSNGVRDYFRGVARAALAQEWA